MKYVPGGIYTALLDGDEEVVEWCLRVEVRKAVGRGGGVDEAVLQFEESAMVKAVRMGDGGRSAVERARKQLRAAYWEKVEGDARLEKSTAVAELDEWRATTRAAFLKASSLIEELIAIAKEENDKPTEDKPPPIPAPTPKDDASDDDALPLTWVPTDVKKVYSAAKRGVRKGIRRGAKIIGLTGKEESKAPKKLPTKPFVTKASAKVKLKMKVNQTHGVSKKALPTGALRDAVASAGMSAGMLGGAISLRKEIENREKAMIEEGGEGKHVTEMVFPAMQDAAIAAGAASGTAWAVAQAAEHPLCQSASAFVGPAVSGLITTVGVGTALHSWSAGKSTQRELRKTIAKISISTSTSLGCLAAASVSMPCAAALAMGTAAMDLSGTTDTIVTQIFGKDRRGVRVELIKCYARVLSVAPTASDEQARLRFRELSDSIAKHGSVSDKTALDEACLRFLMLREEARGNGPKTDFGDKRMPSPTPERRAWLWPWSAGTHTLTRHVGADFMESGE